MNNKQAKKLRKGAELITVGKSKSETRKVYQRLKEVYKAGKK